MLLLFLCFVDVVVLGWGWLENGGGGDGSKRGSCVDECPASPKSTLLPTPSDPLHINAYTRPSFQTTLISPFLSWPSIVCPKVQPTTNDLRP